jgi:hypothetical protein
MNRIITAIFTSVIFASTNVALALPFKTDPESFTSYLNKTNWDDGKRRTFSNLRGCQECSHSVYSSGSGCNNDQLKAHIAIMSIAGVVMRHYVCKYAYITIDDPIRGRIFCEVDQNDAGLAVWFSESLKKNPDKTAIIREKGLNWSGLTSVCRRV